MAVIGSGGSGKPTIARQLARQLGLPVVHLDECYWRPGWRSTDSASWETMQERLLAAGAWIIDGNYLSALELRYCNGLARTSRRRPSGGWPLRRRSGAS